MAAPARVAARQAKALEAIATEVQSVKTGLLQLDAALAEQLDRIEAKLDALAPKPASTPKAK